ncbi:HK97 family phage prohead protease [Ochrobactrum sp. Q0168]|nr:HK97 family phage prohead protease [Ochrobactrum sp. Q0168]
MAKPDLKLETKRASLTLENVEIDGSFSGYASIFGLPDLSSDVIERGAFSRALRERGTSGIRMLNADPGRHTRALCRRQACQGGARKDARTGLRHILEADLWEISVVTFPMLPQARIGQVKSDLPTIREFERWLTRDAGLSRASARTVIAKGYALGDNRIARDAIRHEEAGLAQRMRDAAKTISN